MVQLILCILGLFIATGSTILFDTYIRRSTKPGHLFACCGPVCGIGITIMIIAACAL